MTIYFTASIAGKKYYLDNYLRIIGYLKERGQQVIADHIVSHTESKIRLETREERLEFHRRLEKWINSCDCMVVETSFPSISVGYEISLALRRNKPVLILYAEGDPPSLLDGQSEDKIICEKYGLTALPEILNGFLGFVQGKSESRFTFYVTAEIMAHLDRVAREKKIPKSVYLRQLIEREARRPGASR